MNESNTETVRKLMSLEENDPIDEDIDEAVTEVQDMAARGGRYNLAADVMTLIILEAVAARPAVEASQPAAGNGKPANKRGGRPKGSKNKRSKNKAAKAKDPVVSVSQPENATIGGVPFDEHNKLAAGVE